MNGIFVTAKLKALRSIAFFGYSCEELLKLNTLDSFYKALFADNKEELNESGYYGKIEEKLETMTVDLIERVPGYYNRRNPIINAYVLKYDIENLKLIARSYITGSKICKGLIYTGKDSFTQDSENIDFSDIEDLMKILLLTPYGKITLNLLESHEDLLKIDSELDKYYYKNIYSALNKIRGVSSMALRKMVNIEVNFYNILWALRCNSFYKKRFQDVKDSFIALTADFDESKLSKLMDLDLTEESPLSLFNDGQEYISTIIKESSNNNGIIDILSFERNVKKYIKKNYSSHFYKSSDLMTSVSYIYLIQSEYESLISHLTKLYYKE